MFIYVNDTIISRDNVKSIYVQDCNVVIRAKSTEYYYYKTDSVQHAKILVEAIFAFIEENKSICIGAMHEAIKDLVSKGV